MKDKSFLLQMVTPAQIIYQQEVKKITIRTIDGKITILPYHEPLITVVVPGEAVVLENDNKKRVLAVSEGVLEVRDNRVRILVEAADRVEEMDRKKILEAKKAAEEMIEKARKEGSDEKAFGALKSSLQREMAKLRVYDRYNKRRSL